MRRDESCREACEQAAEVQAWVDSLPTPFPSDRLLSHDVPGVDAAGAADVDEALWIRLWGGRDV